MRPDKLALGGRFMSQVAEVADVVDFTPEKVALFLEDLLEKSPVGYQDHYAYTLVRFCAQFPVPQERVDRLIEEAFLKRHHLFLGSACALASRASTSVQNKILQRLLEIGWSNQAQALVKECSQRNLNRSEIFELVRVYCEGACQSESSEERLIALAIWLLSPDDVKLVRTQIGEMHERWANQID